MNTVRVEFPVPPANRVIVAGLNETVGTLGETKVANLTVPVNPARLVRLTVEAAEPPGVTARPLGLAEVEKSGFEGCATLRRTVTE